MTVTGTWRKSINLPTGRSVVHLPVTVIAADREWCTVQLADGSVTPAPSDAVRVAGRTVSSY